MNLNQLKLAVLSVGPNGGRGFIVERNGDRYVLTAAHCLPELPPAHSCSLFQERICPIGRLDQKPEVLGECIFADPVADIAILACPDEQTLDSSEFTKLVDAAPAFKIGLDRNTLGYRWITANPKHGWMLSLDGKWKRAEYRITDRSLLTTPTCGGQSGSPVLNRFGHAIGIIVVGSHTNDVSKKGVVHGPQPLLSDVLPAWWAKQV